MQNPASTASLLRAAQDVSAFTDWLRDHPEDLADAAELLGGPKWLAMTSRVGDAVRRGRSPAVLLPSLRQLSQLLHLELVSDLHSDEAFRFALINPDDPRADNARRCAEALGRGIRALETVAPVQRAAA